MFSLTFDPIALAVLGLAAVLVGAVELGLGFVKKFPTWGVSLGVVGLLALGGGAAYAADLGVYVGQPLLILSGVCLTLMLFRSKQSVAGRPLVQGAALIVAGVALLGLAVHRIDQGLENEMAKTDFDLAQMADPLEDFASPAHVALSDKGNDLPLFRPVPTAASVTPDAEARYLHEAGFDKKLIQTAPADLKYNCHGWVFTGGQFWLRGTSVDAVLADNGYVAVERPRPGDVAVFRNQAGEVTHTALVRANGKDVGVLLESKWGRYGRFVHGPDEHAYRGQKVTYHRTARGSHLLRGLGPVAGEVVSAEEEE